MKYGYNFIDIKFHQGKAVEYYQKYIDWIKSLGYIVQVTDAVDYQGIYYSTPEYQHIAIYVKKEDGSKVNKSELFGLSYKE